MPAPIGERFASARQRAQTGVIEGRDGVTLAAELAAEVDSILLELCAPHLAKVEGVAILATGGYGRRELAPHSDLDLLFLCAERPGNHVSALAQAILYPLWDIKVDAGHAVRSVDDAMTLPGSDLAAATALLDARFLIGDEDLAQRFLREYLARAQASATESFVARLRAEQQSRHSRFGDTIFLLEPDLKNGPGGVRDLCVGRWAARARFGTSDLRQLVAQGVLTGRMVGELEAAREWLLRVRIASHTAAGRRQDQLRFALQEAVVPAMVRGADIDSQRGLAAGVEILMREFQLHAKAVRRETERLLERAASDPAHRPSIEPVRLQGGLGEPDPAFVLRDGVLAPRDEKVFARKPSEMLRIFAASIELDVPVALHTRELIAERVAASPESVRADPDAASWFLDVLVDRRDRANPSRLQEMHDLGLLAALMPEWEPTTGRVQHDIYHVYTVDQHSLYAVAWLHALGRGELSSQFTGPSQAITGVHNPVVLCMATLLHDVGKPQGSPHAEKGAALALSIARRMRIPEEDARQIEFLVLRHLDMALISQRRDLEDMGMIADFARQVKSEDALRDLYLLTFCDLTSVSPENLTGWKEALLLELYQRTLAFLHRGPDLLSAERAELVLRRKRRAAKLLGRDTSAAGLERLFGGFPDRYFAENSSQRVVDHMRLARTRKGRSVIDVAHHEKLGLSDMVLVADDVPGLLEVVAGVLFANRINIVDAAIYSRAPRPGKPGMALDTFRVRDAYGRAVTDESRWKAIRRDLEAVLAGEIPLDTMAASRPASTSIASWHTPEVPTEIKIDNEVSRDFTVIDVITHDRPGVLFGIARTLHRHGLDIHRSKVATEANKVADVFYVRDSQSGAKLLEEAKMEELKAALVASLPKG